MNRTNDGFEKYPCYGYIRNYGTYNTFKKIFSTPKGAIIAEQPIDTQKLEIETPETEEQKVDTAIDTPEVGTGLNMIKTGKGRRGVGVRGSGAKPKKLNVNSKYLQYTL